MKNISFLSENFQYLEVKFSIYLNRHVFVMGESKRLLNVRQTMKTLIRCRDVRRMIWVYIAF